MRAFRLLLFFFFSFLFAATAQVDNDSKLSIEQIMQGEQFVGFLPQQVSWSQDSKSIYFSWNPEMETVRSKYKIDLEGKKPVKVLPKEERDLPQRPNYNRDHSKMVYAKNGDLFFLNLKTDKKFQITNTIDRESAPSFSGDNKKIVYQRSNNLYYWDIETGQSVQLTNFIKGNEKKAPKTAPERQWLENDQLEYFNVLAERKAKADLREEKRKELEVPRPLAIYLGSKRLYSIRISPDLNFVSYLLASTSRDKGTKVPNYVTESGYIDDLYSRSKVGAPGNSYELGIYDIEQDTTYIVNTSEIEGIKNKPAYLLEYAKDPGSFEKDYEDPREVLINGPIYSDDGKAVLIIRSLDHKDRWIMRIDLPTGDLSLLDRQRDEAWIGGPGVGGWTGNVGWMPDNRHFWYQSEETGFSHLYSIDVESGKKKALTKGKFEILNAFLSKDKSHFYIAANKEGPHEQHFYRMPVAGGKMEQLTKKTGRNRVTLSPDEKQMAILYSFSNKPTELYLMENKSGAKMLQLTHSTTKAFENYSWKEPEIVWIPARDGVKVPARLYKPKNGTANGAGVIFVHGAGYLQNVHKWWSSYYREYMFHHILADNGYTVLDIDYRASSGYGRDWRTAIYRYMGGKDLDDQIDGAKFLVDKYGIDEERLGIYGGSYGGFITLMALFTSPETFKCGAALRSVTDWAHYNHGYTSNILNTPMQDSIAYRRSSPIYHAEGLKNRLLMLHGVVDTNVQFQDVVRLSQRLIELGKDNWELALFPVEGHGFVEPESWTDEYKRIFRLFEEEIGEGE